MNDLRATSQAETHADREWDRFLNVAVPTPNGLGWHDPSEPAEMPRGADGEAWRRFERDCSHLGKRSKT